MRGDEAAFGQIYDLYFEKIYRFVYYRVSHREAAEDLVSEVFIKIWDRVGDIKGAGAFNGWSWMPFGSSGLTNNSYLSLNSSMNSKTTKSLCSSINLRGRSGSSSTARSRNSRNF